MCESQARQSQLYVLNNPMIGKSLCAIAGEGFNYAASAPEIYAA